MLICLHVVLCSQGNALYWACISGDVSRVSELLTRGADINYRDPDNNVSDSIVG